MSNHSGLSRRGFLAASAVTGAGLAAGFSPRASAKAPPLNTQAPGFYRFKIGAIEATVVSDGPLAVGPAKPEFFRGVSADEIAKTFSDNFLPADNMLFEQNALVLNTGGQLVLFDTGIGAPGIMGPYSGRLLSNLKAAGLDPKDIDAVVLSHAHPDHCWGLMTADGSRNFPNAKIFMSEADFNFWTDEGNNANSAVPGVIAPTRKQLLPNRDRITFFKDGGEFMPGVQALAAPGHTVGHTAFMVTSQGKTLCVTADLAHHHVLVMQNPRIEIAFDTDPKQGVTSRVRVFDMLAAQRVPLISYHFPWPGLGHVAKQGEGYRYVPMPMQMAL